MLKMLMVCAGLTVLIGSLSGQPNKSSDGEKVTAENRQPAKIQPGGYNADNDARRSSRGCPSRS
ncbi:MAG: hypothetical protein ACP5E5_12505 [Acidobacteriaceae bacterium]